MRKWLTLALIALQLALFPAHTPFLNSTGQAFAASQPPDEDSDEQQDGEKSGPDLFDKLEIGAARLAGRMATREALVLTRSQIAQKARQLGYSLYRGAGRLHGQEIFKNGTKYISRDIDSHSGGFWKMFTKNGNRLTRVGTYNEDLTQQVGP
jgi:hypothetical protein